MKNLLMVVSIVFLLNHADSHLTQEWEARKNAPANLADGAYSIAFDGAGNVYVTGSSKNGAAALTEDYATIKYNSAGVQQWASRYNEPGKYSI